MPLSTNRPSQALIDLVGALGGSWHGPTAMCRCPAHADTSPSLSLRQGDRDILVTCFAGCERGDVLRALSRVRPRCHYPVPTAGAAAPRANVDRLWAEAVGAGEGLPQRYLAGRGFMRVPFDVRYHPRCPHGPVPRTQFKPAVLVAVREGRQLVAVQRIFLDPETAAYTAKATLGTLARGAWRGRGPTTTLALAEGFETAEAFSLLNGHPCWATLGARRLDQVDIPATITTLLIAEDNDAEGRRAAARACDHYARPGRDVRRAPPPARLKDWAEVLDAEHKTTRPASA